MLTVDDVARITRLSKITIRAAVRDGDLSATRLRRRILVSSDDLAAWIDSGKVRAAGAVARAQVPARPAARRRGPAPDPREAVRAMNRHAA